MPTECSPALFDFAPVEGRAVVAGFDGGAITCQPTPEPPSLATRKRPLMPSSLPRRFQRPWS